VTDARPAAEVPPVPPYFDDLFERLEAGDAGTTAAFGRHVHWGYWPTPEHADGSPADYAVAAERLCVEVCNAAQIRDGLGVLDVGCGFGGTIASLNERFRDLDLTGVNIDARQLDRARRTIMPQNGNRIRFVEGDACDLTFAPGSFDVVLAVECIFHFADRAAFFAGAARCLKPGGRMAVSDFVPTADALPWIAANSGGRDGTVQRSYGHVDFFCPLDRYRELARQTGFELVQADDITRHTLPTYPFLQQRLPPRSNPQEARAFKRATSRLEAASSKGMLNYTILAFQKT
jgi:cyclopropane fatty-acyl-phospholipid synthase-like methyltransferase